MLQWELNMYLGLALITFVLYVGHVFLGSFWGVSLIGDIGELLLLICATVLFVIAILQAERSAKSDETTP
jgi:hypothetical protein